MAGPSNSPAFVPPTETVTDNDPMVVRIPLDRVDIGFRPSQQKGLMDHNTMTVKHIPNGS